MDTSLARADGRAFGRSAFTLIELLVVVAIIALLLAILVPSLQRARELARQAVCQSHERPMGIGIHQYVQDNTEIIPPRFYVFRPDNPPSVHYWVWFWADFIAPYFDAECRPGVPTAAQVCNTSVAVQPINGVYVRDYYGLPVVYSRRMSCPSQLANPKKDSTGQPFDQFHFSWNIADGWQGDWGQVNKTGWTTGMKMSIYKGPSKLVQIVEPDPMNWWSINLAADSGSYHGVPGSGFYGLVPYGYQTPHMDRTDALFLDGHVEVLTKSFILNFASKPYDSIGYPFYMP